MEKRSSIINERWIVFNILVLKFIIIFVQPTFKFDNRDFIERGLRKLMITKQLKENVINMWYYLCRMDSLISLFKIKLINSNIKLKLNI